MKFHESNINFSNNRHTKRLQNVMPEISNKTLLIPSRCNPSRKANFSSKCLSIPTLVVDNTGSDSRYNCSSPSSNRNFYVPTNFKIPVCDQTVKYNEINNFKDRPIHTSNESLYYSSLNSRNNVDGNECVPINTAILDTINNTGKRNNDSIKSNQSNPNGRISGSIEKILNTVNGLSDVLKSLSVKNTSTVQPPDCEKFLNKNECMSVPYGFRNDDADDMFKKDVTCSSYIDDLRAMPFDVVVDYVKHYLSQPKAVIDRNAKDCPDFTRRVSFKLDNNKPAMPHSDYLQTNSDKSRGLPYSTISNSPSNNDCCRQFLGQTKHSRISCCFPSSTTHKFLGANLGEETPNSEAFSEQFMVSPNILININRNGCRCKKLLERASALESTNCETQTFTGEANDSDEMLKICKQYLPQNRCPSNKTMPNNFQIGEEVSCYSSSHMPFMTSGVSKKVIFSPCGLNTDNNAVSPGDFIRQISPPYSQMCTSNSGFINSTKLNQTNYNTYLDDPLLKNNGNTLTSSIFSDCDFKIPTIPLCIRRADDCYQSRAQLKTVCPYYESSCQSHSSDDSPYKTDICKENKNRYKLEFDNQSSSNPNQSPIVNNITIDLSKKMSNNKKKKQKKHMFYDLSPKNDGLRLTQTGEESCSEVCDLTSESTTDFHHIGSNITSPKCLNFIDEHFEFNGPFIDVHPTPSKYAERARTHPCMEYTEASTQIFTKENECVQMSNSKNITNNKMTQFNTDKSTKNVAKHQRAVKSQYFTDELEFEQCQRADTILLGKVLNPMDLIQIHPDPAQFLDCCSEIPHKYVKKNTLKDDTAIGDSSLKQLVENKSLKSIEQKPIQNIEESVTEKKQMLPVIESESVKNKRRTPPTSSLVEVTKKHPQNITKRNIISSIQSEVTLGLYPTSTTKPLISKGDGEKQTHLIRSQVSQKICENQPIESESVTTYHENAPIISANYNYEKDDKEMEYVTPYNSHKLHCNSSISVSSKIIDSSLQNDDNINKKYKNDTTISSRSYYSNSLKMTLVIELQRPSMSIMSGSTQNKGSIDSNVTHETSSAVSCIQKFAFQTDFSNIITDNVILNHKQAEHSKVELENKYSIGTQHSLSYNSGETSMKPVPLSSLKDVPETISNSAGVEITSTIIIQSSISISIRSTNVGNSLSPKSLSLQHPQTKSVSSSLITKESRKFESKKTDLLEPLDASTTLSYNRWRNSIKSASLPLTKDNGEMVTRGTSIEIIPELTILNYLSRSKSVQKDSETDQRKTIINSKLSSRKLLQKNSFSGICQESLQTTNLEDILEDVSDEIENRDHKNTQTSLYLNTEDYTTKLSQFSSTEGLKKIDKGSMTVGSVLPINDSSQDMFKTSLPLIKDNKEMVTRSTSIEIIPELTILNYLSRSKSVQKDSETDQSKTIINSEPKSRKSLQKNSFSSIYQESLQTTNLKDKLKDVSDEIENRDHKNTQTSLYLNTEDYITKVSQFSSTEELKKIDKGSITIGSALPINDSSRDPFKSQLVSKNTQLLFSKPNIAIEPRQNQSKTNKSLMMGVHIVTSPNYKVGSRSAISTQTMNTCRNMCGGSSESSMSPVACSTSSANCEYEPCCHSYHCRQWTNCRYR